MIVRSAASLLLLAFLAQPALSLDNDVKLSNVPTDMVGAGTELNSKELKATTKLSFDSLKGLNDGIITDLLSKVSQTPISEQAGTTRSAKDAQIYRAISPSVVLVVTKEGLGSGS